MSNNVRGQIPDISNTYWRRRRYTAYAGLSKDGDHWFYILHDDAFLHLHQATLLGGQITLDKRYMSVLSPDRWEEAERLGVAIPADNRSLDSNKPCPAQIALFKRLFPHYLTPLLSGSEHDWHTERGA